MYREQHQCLSVKQLRSMVTGTFLCLCNGSSIVIFKKSLCLFDGNDVTDTILFASVTVMKLPLPTWRSNNTLFPPMLGRDIVLLSKEECFLRQMTIIAIVPFSQSVPVHWSLPGSRIRIWRQITRSESNLSAAVINLIQMTNHLFMTGQTDLIFCNGRNQR